MLYIAGDEFYFIFKLYNLLLIILYNSINLTGYLIRIDFESFKLKASKFYGIIRIVKFNFSTCMTI